MNVESGAADYPIAQNRHGVLLVLCAVLPVMAIVSLVPILPLLIREFEGVEGAAVLVPVAMTIPALCVALFSPLAGWLSDRLGRKRLLLCALLAYAAIGVIPVWLTDLHQIIAARFGLGIAEAVIMTIATALIGDYYEGGEREKWIGIQVGVVSLSAVLISALGGILGELVGSRGPFLLYLLAVPIAIAVAVVLFEPRVVINKVHSTSSFPWSKVAPLLLITLIVSMFFYTAMVNIGPILELVGDTSPAVIGTVAALYNVGVAAGSYVYQRVKQAPEISLLAAGMLLYSAGYIGLGLSNSVVITTAFAFIGSLAAGMLLPTMLNWIMRVVRPEQRGSGTGLWTGMFFFGQFIAPIVAAGVVGLTSGLGNSLLAYGAAAATGLILALIARGRSKRVAG